MHPLFRCPIFRFLLWVLTCNLLNWISPRLPWSSSFCEHWTRSRSCVIVGPSISTDLGPAYVFSANIVRSFDKRGLHSRSSRYRWKIPRTWRLWRWRVSPPDSTINYEMMEYYLAEKSVDLNFKTGVVRSLSPNIYLCMFRRTLWL